MDFELKLRFLSNFEFQKGGILRYFCQLMQIHHFL
jgi:hypothetical protein